jgi:hypothetical protein
LPEAKPLPHQPDARASINLETTIDIDNCDDPCERNKRVRPVMHPHPSAGVVVRNGRFDDRKTALAGVLVDENEKAGKGAF